MCQSWQVEGPKIHFSRVRFSTTRLTGTCTDSSSRCPTIACTDAVAYASVYAAVPRTNLHKLKSQGSAFCQCISRRRAIGGHEPSPLQCRLRRGRRGTSPVRLMPVPLPERCRCMSRRRPNDRGIADDHKLQTMKQVMESFVVILCVGDV